ncbi:MAG TPA: VacJ family lipoprotein [Gammaproteobacteria bacterium]|jgi:phospholipid-binding lipoprotein MlaA|nr:VacJ family lipoprotein [Gammaproteobacteria bacterium]
MANQLSGKLRQLACGVGITMMLAAGSVLAAEDQIKPDTNNAPQADQPADTSPAPSSPETSAAKPTDPESAADASAAAATDTAATDATGAESAVADSGDVEVFNDPFETFNRHTFAFNDFLDTNILQPVARFYNKIMPKPLNQGVHNFFLNLNTFSTIIDDFLQFNFYQMTNDSWRFAINSTIGVGGLFDMASRMGLKYYENDFGMTLATWGWKNSNYLVLPFYGSYTVRDGFSLPFDFFLFSAYQFIEPPRLRYGLYAVSVVDWRAQTMKYNELLETAALDKYVFVRNAYMQRRAYQLDENRHLGVYDREKEFSGVNPDDSSTGPGAGANVDESANIGQPANTDRMQQSMNSARSWRGHTAHSVS